MKKSRCKSESLNKLFEFLAIYHVLKIYIATEILFFIKKLLNPTTVEDNIRKRNIQLVDNELWWHGKQILEDYILLISCSMLMR